MTQGTDRPSPGGEPVAWEYSPWGPVMDHAHITAFESVERLADGVHRIALGDGALLELLVAGDPLRAGRSGSIPLFFSGALGDRSGTAGPYFSGRGFAARLGTGFLAFSDPLFRDHAALGLAWYTGGARSGAQATMARVARHVATMSGRSLLAVGGSGGGFASLELASRVDAVHAFVWNPQTRILDYDPGAVRAYLGAMFGGTFEDDEWRQRAEQLLDDAGIVHDLTRDARSPRGLYLQNATDWHVQRHLAPYLGAKALPHRGRGYYGAERSHGVLVGDFGQGHSVPDMDLLVAAIDVLRTGDGDAWAAFTALSDGGWLRPESFAHLPVDLRGARATVLADVVLDVQGAPGGVRCTATLQRQHPRLTFQFYAYGESGRIASSAPSARGNWDLTTETAVTRVVCTVRDGMGNTIGQVHGAPSDGDDAPAVLVYGSCVSRDAFELSEAPHLAAYVARSGLASAMSQEPTGLEGADLSANSSAFQRRMVALDLSRGLGGVLAETAFSHLLVDLIDERFTLARGPRGGLFTISPELERAGVSTGSFERFRSGSPEHLEGFRAGWARLCELVPADRIIVNKVYWAAIDETGAAVSDPAVVAAANDVLDALYGIVEEVSPGVRWLRYDRELFVSDTGHRWGASPFHFSHPLYVETLRQLALEAAGSAPATTPPIRGDEGP